MKDIRRRVIKEAKPSGNSGSVYVPKEWVGHMVEIKLYSVESMVLEALFPYLESIQGIYLYGPHARGEGTPEQDIDVLVVSDRELPVDKIDCLNIEVIKESELDDYVRTDPAGYSSMIAEAVPVMNQSLLEKLKARASVKEGSGGLSAELEKALAIAKSLQQDGDLSSAAYTLVNRLRDFLAVSSADGRFSYERLEEIAGKGGINSDKFRKLYGVYEAKKDDKPVEYNVSSADIMRLYLLLNEVRKKGVAPAGDKAEEKSEIKENAGEPVKGDIEELTRDKLLDRARKFRENGGGSDA